MSYDLDAFSGISEEAKDFIAKLLVFAPGERLDVRAALAHPWLQSISKPPPKLKDMSTDRLKLYLDRFRSVDSEGRFTACSRGGFVMSQSVFSGTCPFLCAVLGLLRRLWLLCY